MFSVIRDSNSRPFIMIFSWHTKRTGSAGGGWGVFDATQWEGREFPIVHGVCNGKVDYIIMLLKSLFKLFPSHFILKVHVPMACALTNKNMEKIYFIIWSTWKHMACISRGSLSTSTLPHFKSTGRLMPEEQARTASRIREGFYKRS